MEANERRRRGADGAARPTAPASATAAPATSGASFIVALDRGGNGDDGGVVGEVLIFGRRARAIPSVGGSRVESSLGGAASWVVDRWGP